MRKTQSHIRMLCIVLLFCLKANAVVPYDESDFSDGYKIGVVTDTHIMSPELIINDGSALQNHLNADRKLLLESGALADAVINSMIDEKVNLVIVAGDLTKCGERVSHDYFVKKFSKLIAAGIKVIVTPGNHDIRDPYSIKYDGDNWSYTPTVTANEFAEIYKDYGYGQSISRDSSSLSYVTEPISGLRLLVLDGCNYENNLCVLEGESEDLRNENGHIKEGTIKWIKDQAADAKQEGKLMLGVIHHGLVEHFTCGQALASSYLLDNFQDVQKTLLDADVPLAFTGHSHTSDIKYVADGNKKLYDIETGALVTYPCSYRIITINKRMSVLNVVTKCADNVDWPTEGLSFTEYAKKKMSEGVPTLMEYAINDNYDEIKAGLPWYAEILLDMPSKENFAKTVVDKLGIPVTDLMLTFNQGNEHHKDGQKIIDEVNDGIDGIVKGLAKISITKGILLDYVKDMDDYKKLQDAMRSIMFNTITPSRSEENAANISPYTVYNDTIDDLSLTIDLPQRIKTCITDKHGDAPSLEVYPCSSIDGNLKIKVESVSAGMIQIFNVTGNKTAEIYTAAGGTTIDYHFSAPGIYVIKYKSSYQKVFVK